MFFFIVTSLHIIYIENNNIAYPYLNNLRSSGGKGAKNFGRWGSLKDKRHNSQASLTSVHQRGTVRHSADSDSGTECVHTFQRAALYILGEKSHMKVIK